ncbi:hypothetical protein Dimus_036106, partial [Dionaea muscipula]
LGFFDFSLRFFQCVFFDFRSLCLRHSVVSRRRLLKLTELFSSHRPAHRALQLVNLIVKLLG